MTTSHTVGYAFAYFAWMQLATPNSYRAEAALRGSTFFLTFESLQLESIQRDKSDDLRTPAEIGK